MKYFGAHVSIAGGVANAPLNAARIGADAFAMFTKNQRQWSSPPLTAEDIAAFRENCTAHGFAPAHILPHDSYLINLGQPDPVKHRSAVAAFIDEMQRCEQLGLVKLNFHPGSHLNAVSVEECLSLIATGMKAALEATQQVHAVIENTAGQGTNLGFALEHLARLIELLDASPRVGVCIDTCHTYAAGYDLDTPEGYERFWARFEKLIGYERLEGMHLNDAKAGLNSHLDRHESLGAGTLGWDLFGRIATDPHLENIPLVLETPDEDLWANEIARLKELAKNTD